VIAAEKNRFFHRKDIIARKLAKHCATYVINARTIDVSRRANIWSPNDMVSIENMNSRQAERYIAWFLIGDIITLVHTSETRPIRRAQIFRCAHWNLIIDSFRFAIFFFYNSKYFMSKRFSKTRDSCFIRSFALYIRIAYKRYANNNGVCIAGCDIFISDRFANPTIAFTTLIFDILPFRGAFLHFSAHCLWYKLSFIAAAYRVDFLSVNILTEKCLSIGRQAISNILIPNSRLIDIRCLFNFRMHTWHACVSRCAVYGHVPVAMRHSKVP